MMRTHSFAAAGLLGALAWSCAPPNPARLAERSVAVDVRCSGEEVVFTVNPWRLELDEGDDVVWELADPGQTITVEKKRTSGWPYRNNRATGNRADPPYGRGMKGGQRGKAFQYSIAVTCQEPAGREVIMDPEMYVKGQ